MVQSFPVYPLHFPADRLRSACLLSYFDNLNDIVKVAGHSVIVCARLSGLRVQQYRRRLLIASNRHTAPPYFRCMGGTGYMVKNDRVQDASPARERVASCLFRHVAKKGVPRT